ncbi:MAG TPA: hypothetical protein VMF69_20740 [Gemmataceae bacterium]|nr:hypothetical protein [Gemmataceae bacterium]
MSSSPGRYFVLLLLCAAIALPLRSQETSLAKQSASPKISGSPKKSVPAAEGKKAVELKKVDLSSLPAEAVIVICERVNEALDLLPKAVILKPEKYQALLDEIDRLNKQLEKQKIDNSTPPTRCFLRGKVESGAVRLEAEFDGTAEHADTLVSLACPQAGASSAETDGRMALIHRSNAGGFLVRIDKPGEYHVKLDLLVPLAGREGNGRGFELTLPRAVITQLDLDLPANCTDVRVGGQLLKDLQLPGLELKNNHLSGNPGLGPVDKFDLSWKEARYSAGDPVRMAEGLIQVRLDRAGLATEADLWLTVEGAPAKVWRLLVPRNAEIKVLPSDKETRVEHRIETADQKFASLRTIHLREARSEPLHVQVKLSLLPLRGSAMPVGPFFVLDAARQTGTVRVRNQVRNLHLDYRGRGDMQLRRQEEETKEESPATLATLVYSNIPMVEKPEGTVGPKSLSWLDLEAVKVPVQVRMRVSHTLTLRSEVGAKNMAPGLPGANGPSVNRRLYWQVATTIAPATTKWADVEQLKVLVPPEWEPSDENVSVVPNSNPRCVTIPASLLREAPTQSQRLQGRYKSSYQAEEHAILKLPQPQGTIESCEVKIEAAADAEVAVHNAEQINLELSRQSRPNEQSWRCRSVPAEGLGIEMSWRSYRPELRAVSVVDLTLNGNHGDVSHELRLQLPPTPPPFLILRVPAASGDSLRIQDDQGQEVRSIKSEIRNPKSETPPSLSDFGFRIPVPAKDGGKEWRLMLQYTTLLGEKDQAPRAGEPFVVPLVAAEQATASDIKVRIWSEPGALPRAASPRWEEWGIEEVKDRALPVLVLHATKLNAHLRLVIGEQEASFSALVERTLMRVQLEEGGAQSWLASFQLRQLADRNLDVLMPAPVATLKNAQFFFNRHEVTPDLVNDQGERNPGGSIARLRLSPDLVRQTALLEVSFQSPPSRSGASPLHTTLYPPRILRATAAPTCWQVSVPATRVLIAPESGAGVERTWKRRGWLLAASLIEPAELRHDSEPAALVYWQDQDVPLVLTHAPQLAWWLVCSLGLLVVAWGLYWSALPQANKGGRLAGWLWPLLALATLAVAIAALFWPTMLCAIVYGCEPGAVVLLAFLAVQWLRHQRYRRQIVFLPSFSRGRASSSLIRKNSSHRPQSGEPSTVDAPPPSVG